MRWFRAPRRAYRRLCAFLDDLNRQKHQLARMETQLARLAEQLESHRREMRLVLGPMTTPPDALWRHQPPLIPGQPAADALPHSSICRQADFQTPWFSYWSVRLNEGLRYHRKLWEFVYIAQALWERGVLKPGARGLGFGVGEEPLSAYFASQHCEVTATDIDAEMAVAAGWAATNQHADGKAALHRPLVCPDDLFQRNVVFRTCDMNAVPDDLTGYDFCWSACALEHLGSIALGLAFIERSLECLRPGGWAVHTTEFNQSSNHDTVDHCNTVLFRRRDLEALVARLEAQGHRVAPLDLAPGEGAVDRYVDLPPYRLDPHLRLALEGYAITSVGLIIQKAPA